jgi:beta-fructofuranosidase
MDKRAHPVRATSGIEHDGQIALATSGPLLYTPATLSRRTGQTAPVCNFTSTATLMMPRPTDTSADPHRPRYHFLPAANWINDPNGLIQWKGQYHLFYQYNPNGPFHGTIHWGHAVSADLVHWTELPIALAPSPGGPDKDGCGSGCAVDNGGVPTLLYTGVYPQTQCLAWSDDDLLTWKKHPNNPVLAAPPDVDVVGGAHWDWRDPWVWRENDAWFMLIGSGIRGVGGAVFLYQSADLIHWEYLHPLLVGDQLNLGEVWECPNYFSLGDREVLLISPVPESRHTYFLIGAAAQRKFSPEAWGKLDHGPCFYAALTMRDDRQRRLLWGWIKEGRDAAAQQAAGWSGVMSLPRLLSLLPDGALGIEPAPELAALRGQHQRWADLTLRGDLRLDVQGHRLEIIAEFEPNGAERFGFWIYRSPDDEEQTLIAYDMAQQCFVVDRRQSSLNPAVERDVQSAPYPLAAGGRLKLHLLLDHSVVEAFVDGRFSLTTRVYPTRADSAQVVPVAVGGGAAFKSLDVWTLNPIS